MSPEPQSDPLAPLRAALDDETLRELLRPVDLHGAAITLEELEAMRAVLLAKIGPLWEQLRGDRALDHSFPENCSTYYDGCNCREAIDQHIARATAAEAELTALRARVGELEQEMKVTDGLLERREATLRLIPECEQHGLCLPHCDEWIAKAKAKMQPDYGKPTMSPDQTPQPVTPRCVLCHKMLAAHTTPELRICSFQYRASLWRGIIEGAADKERQRLERELAR